MKNVILALAMICVGVSAFAQGAVDVKVSPLGLIFSGNFDVSAEYAVTENFGLEVGLRPRFGEQNLFNFNYQQRGLGGFVAGRYYFSPKKGADGFNVGAYVRGRSSSFNTVDEQEVSENFSWNRIAAGIIGGQKWVGDNGLVFELDLGVGRAIQNKATYDATGNSVDTASLPLVNLDLLGRVAVGYRFGGT